MSASRAQVFEGADERVLGRGGRDLGMRKRRSIRDEHIKCQCVTSQAVVGDVVPHMTHDVMCPRMADPSLAC